MTTRTTVRLGSLDNLRAARRVVFMLTLTLALCLLEAVIRHVRQDQVGLAVLAFVCEGYACAQGWALTGRIHDVVMTAQGER